jgi:hypothetical protein
LQLVVVDDWEKVFRLDQISILILFGDQLFASKELVQADDDVEVVELELVLTPLDDGLEHALDLAHALLDVLLGLADLLRWLGVGHHLLDLELVQLEEDLEDEVAAERGVDALFRLGLGAVADDDLGAFRAVGQGSLGGGATG